MLLWIVEKGETFLSKDIVTICFDKEEAQKAANKQMALGSWKENGDTPDLWESGCEYVSLTQIEVGNDPVQEAQKKIANLIRRFAEEQTSSMEFHLFKLAKQIENGEY